MNDRIPIIQQRVTITPEFIKFAQNPGKIYMIDLPDDLTAKEAAHLNMLMFCIMNVAASGQPVDLLRSAEAFGVMRLLKLMQ